MSVQLKIKGKGCQQPPLPSHACRKSGKVCHSKTEANLLQQLGFHFPRGIERFARSAEMEIIPLSFYKVRVCISAYKWHFHLTLC